MKLTEFHQSCPNCGGPAFSDLMLAEKKDACYYKVKASAKVWPSAYASGRLVQCRKKGAANYGNKSEGRLNEFAPGGGSGESGRWYTDDQMTDLVGDGWYNDLDVSGDIPKQQMIEQAQAWLDDQGYNVQVLNCKVNDDDMKWFIEGNFYNPRFAKKGVVEGSGFDQEAGIGIDGKSFKFKIRDLVALADNYPVTKIDPQQFSKQIAGRDEDSTQSMARAEKADLQYPIIVVKRQNGQLWIADGTHRAHKAIMHKLPSINAKIIPIKDMAPFDVDQGVAEAQLDEKCWDTHKQVGMKNKGGRQVPNCVPKESIEETYMEQNQDELARILELGGVQQDQNLVEEFDLIENIIEGIAEHNGVDAETVWADLESLTEDELYAFAVTSQLNEDWQKANKRDRTDGMSQKAVNAYRRENPGSKLKTAVTTKPSKLKKGGKASKRRKSYCSRSRGQMKMHSISCAKTPDKAICKARRRWNC